MNSKTGSLLALGIAVLGILFLVQGNHIFSKNPISMTIQVFAGILMIWSRITFGMRSFHASANTTAGELVTNGPYKRFRHPIYASLIYFFWATVISYPFIETVGAVVLITGGLSTRMLLEEKFLLATYPDYADYSKKTKRIIPFLF